MTPDDIKSLLAKCDTYCKAGVVDVEIDPAAVAELCRIALDAKAQVIAELERVHDSMRGVSDPITFWGQTRNARDVEWRYEIKNRIVELREENK